MCVCVVKLGTLGAGNHYAEIQVVDEIYNDYAAKKMGIDHKGQVCVMIHSGSRGLGHQVATGGWCSATHLDHSLSLPCFFNSVFDILSAFMFVTHFKLSSLNSAVSLTSHFINLTKN